MERGLGLDEKKSFISGGFVVYLPPLMLRANTINWKFCIRYSSNIFVGFASVTNIILS